MSLQEDSQDPVNPQSNEGEDENQQGQAADMTEPPQAAASSSSQQQQQQANNDTNNTATKTVTPPVIPADWTQLACDQAPVIRYPTDVAGPEVWDKTETESIMLVGTSGQKITHLGADFSTTLNPQLQRLVLRSHLITNMQGLSSFQALNLLELYDNQIEELHGLDAPFGRTLTVLDMSYNVIRDMSPVQACPNLKELCEYFQNGKEYFVLDCCRNMTLSHANDLSCYLFVSTTCDRAQLTPFVFKYNTTNTDLANNKLKVIQGLSGLSQLQKLDLGANRFRTLPADELAGLTSLTELWLGKNKIESMEGLEALATKTLRRLDIQSNRLTAIDVLPGHVQETLEELYLTDNGIETAGLAGLQEGIFPY